MRNVVADLMNEADKIGYQSFYVNDSVDLNSILANVDLTDSGIIMLILPVSGSSKFGTMGVTESYQHSTILLFGRKTEQEETISNVGETQKEKWDNRIFELYNEGVTFIENFFAPCPEKNYTIVSSRWLQQINKSSSNIDFAQIEISFTEWKQ